MFTPIYEQSGVNNNSVPKGLILIFTEGTIIGHKRFLDIFNFKKYIPIGDCINKIRHWKDDGWEITYLTSRKSVKQVNEIRDILKKFNFPGNLLYYRGVREKYKDIAENLFPDILIEDDCKSIGGKWQMTITYINNDIKDKIKSIVVKEFRGIDHLPDNVNELMKYNCSDSLSSSR